LQVANNAEVTELTDS